MIADGVLPDPGKTRSVANSSTALTLKQVPSFLGHCIQFRKHIADSPNRSESLNEPLRSDVTFQWNSEQEETFRSLMSEHSTSPALGHSVQRACTEVPTDAS